MTTTVAFLAARNADKPHIMRFPAERAARLESIGFEQVYDYVAGKADSGSSGLPLEGANGSHTRAGAHLRTDIPLCRPGDRLRTVCEQLDQGGWDTCLVVDENRVVLSLTHADFGSPR